MASGVAKVLFIAPKSLCLRLFAQGEQSRERRSRERANFAAGQAIIGDKKRFRLTLSTFSTLFRLRDSPSRKTLKNRSGSIYIELEVRQETSEFHWKTREDGIDLTGNTHGKPVKGIYMLIQMSRARQRQRRVVVSTYHESSDFPRKAI